MFLRFYPQEEERYLFSLVIVLGPDDFVEPCEDFCIEAFCTQKIWGVFWCPSP